MGLFGAVVREGKHQYIRLISKLIQYVRVALHIVEVQPRQILDVHSGLVGPDSPVIGEQQYADIIGFVLGALEGQFIDFVFVVWYFLGVFVHIVFVEHAHVPTLGD